MNFFHDVQNRSEIPHNFIFFPLQIIMKVLIVLACLAVAALAHPVNCK